MATEATKLLYSECLYGHARTPDNLRPRGQCRRCQKIRNDRIVKLRSEKRAEIRRNKPDPTIAFWAKALKDQSGCWLWTGQKNNGGYGVACFKGHRTSAHRLAYQLARGPIPAGLSVCHRCDVRECFNPDHLFLGTAADNAADCVSKNRQAKGDKVKPKTPFDHPKGEAVHNARLTESQVYEIYAMREIGRSYGAIAKHFNVHIQTVASIATGQSWRHLWQLRKR